MGHPDAASLLEAVRGFLGEVEGRLPARQAFHAKVAGNVLAIVMRELAARPEAAEAAALAPFGGVAGVCAGLREGRLDPEDGPLLAALAAAAVARLAVDNPRYSTLGRLRERMDDGGS
ncbi:DUF6285 domain-containing protein [Sandaracinobacteroides saxicola]|uniref:Protein kinase n=1 Tax=Sandaracinobacteroides saxicola TaxID=2759707 RepID=A0A7G5IEM8_9SPHN|nr:DUF6285 domain-containing protein [Sandaracinobacteroides saxicola]QMW21820.1 protein kinase [Sandaracinobacteroides saxicola]